MQPYRHRGGETGIVGFEPHDHAIILKFKDASLYLYDEKRPGKKHVEAMKKLAQTGRGLATYLNKFVRGNYANRLR